MKKIPLILLSILIFLLPFKDLFWLGNFWNLLKIYIPFLIYLYLIFVLTGLIKINKFWIKIFFILLFFKTLSFVGSIWFGYQMNLWAYARDLADILLMVYTANLINSKEKINQISYVLIWTFFIANIALLIVYFLKRNLLFSLGMENTTAEMRGGIGNPHDFAQSLSLIAPINFYLLIEAVKEKKKKLIWFLGISFILLFLSSIITFSRSAVFITIFISIFIILKEKLFFRKEFWTVFLVIIIFISLAFIFKSGFGEYFKERYYLTQSRIQEVYYQEPGFNLRKVLANSALTLFVQNPIFGVGPGNFIEESFKICGLNLSAENMYLHILAENGILFSFIWWLTIFLLFVRLKMGQGKSNVYVKMYQFVLLSIILNGIFDITQADPMSFILLGVIFSKALNENINK